MLVPNPKGKLFDQVREVMRFHHYSLRTEKTYCPRKRLCLTRSFVDLRHSPNWVCGE
jgi:hypothetical protein